MIRLPRMLLGSQTSPSTSQLLPSNPELHQKFIRAHHDSHITAQSRFTGRWQPQKGLSRNITSPASHSTRWQPKNDTWRRQLAVSCSSQQELVSEPTSKNFKEKLPQVELDCVASGLTVECVIHNNNSEAAGPYAAESPEGALAAEQLEDLRDAFIAGEQVNGALLEEQVYLEQPQEEEEASYGVLTSAEGSSDETIELLSQVGALLLLISPFFFWGSSMVAMKDVLPRAGPMFVASFRLIPAGLLLVAFAAWKGRPMPSSAMAWISIAAFAAVDAACFQGFLAEGLKRTSAGLGSVIIDSQPLTVAVLAAILFGEHLGPRGITGLALGIVGLCLLEIPGDAIASSLAFLSVLPSSFLEPSTVTASLPLADSVTMAISTAAATVPATVPQQWDLLESGEWWMLLAAQSMAVGTVMVRWVCKHADPIMATGWHLVIGGIPLLVLSTMQQDPALQPGGLGALSGIDWTLLGYTSVFGSAVSYGVFFYNASRGNLTKLSSLTFLTPAFAALFGYLFLNETLNGQQLFGALVTLVAIYLVNTQQSAEKGT